MDPLISALLVVGWGLFSLWVGSRAMHRARAVWLKLVALPVVTVVTLFAPFADEIVGAIQFERYCAAANHVPIYATIPVGEELYFPDGRWRLGEPLLNISLAERNRLDQVIKSYLQYERDPPRPVAAVMPIVENRYRIRDRKTGRLLTEYTAYHTRGGWLSRHGAMSPTFGRAQCFPPQRSGLERGLLTSNMKRGER